MTLPMGSLSVGSEPTTTINNLPSRDADSFCAVNNVVESVNA